MLAVAKAKFLRTAPLKTRIVIDTIRGKSVSEALAILQFTPNAAARLIEKVVKSAAANAENNHRMNSDRLKVSLAVVDEGPRMKRVRYAPMGRGYRMLKRMSHITVGVEEADIKPSRFGAPKQTAKAEGKRRTARKAPAAATAKTEGKAVEKKVEAVETNVEETKVVQTTDVVETQTVETPEVKVENVAENTDVETQSKTANDSEGEK